MGTYLNPSNEDFQANLNVPIYVDKTGLIELTNSRIFAGERRYVCVSRPRRSGKSVAADMLVAYYSRGCDSKEMFKDFEIAKREDFEKHLNRYNVIHLLMTRFFNRKNKTVDMVLDCIEREVIKEMRKEFADLTLDSDDLISCLEDVYQETGVKFVFVIDEWDCIFRERRFDQDGQKEYLDFLRDLFKNQTYVALSYMTGILPIKKYGKHSALNMFDEISMTRLGRFAKYAGFTEDEVKALCERYGRSYEDIESYYKGYNADGLALYNPVDIDKCMHRKDIDAYWAKTEDYTLLTQYFEMDGVKEVVEKMLAGEKVRVNTGCFDNSMTKLRDRDDVLTLLVHLGYLTYEYTEFFEERVWIPNEEIRRQFEDNLEMTR